MRKKMLGLVRRLVSTPDGRLTFSEFAKVLKPTDLRPYLKRIRKYTKEERKQVQKVKHDYYAIKKAQFRKDLSKPLTAFKASEVMLNKDPERHVKLMPARYGT